MSINTIQYSHFNWNVSVFNYLCVYLIHFWIFADIKLKVLPDGLIKLTEDFSKGIRFNLSALDNNNRTGLFGWKNSLSV